MSKPMSAPTGKMDMYLMMVEMHAPTDAAYDWWYASSSSFSLAESTGMVWRRRSAALLS